MTSTKIMMLRIAFLFMFNQNVCLKLYIRYSQYSIIYYPFQITLSGSYTFYAGQMKRFNHAKSNNPALVFDKKGHLVAIATGVDATAEHEGGSKELMSTLCEQYAGEDHLISQTRDGKKVKFPIFLDIKRITRFPKGLVFEETSGGAGSLPEAIMGYAPNKMALRIYEAELMFPVLQI